MEPYEKTLSLILAAALCLALAACGGPASSAPDAAGSAGQSSADGSAQPSDTSAPDGGSSAAGSDLAYVQDKGTLVVGMTDFAPMDYRDEDGEWIGFDADMAKLFAEDLGVQVEFIEINWDNKLMELDTKGIDVVWNGMTINDEVKAGASVSEPYCRNGQVVVVPADRAGDYQTVDSLSGLNFAVENGSAGADSEIARACPTWPRPPRPTP